MHRTSKGEDPGPGRERDPLRDLSEAESLFIGLLDAMPSGEAPDVALLCARRPDLTERLRELQSCFEHGETMVAVLASEAGEQTPLSRRYRILRPLARGGMGEILEVFDENLQRILAMKILRRDRASPSPHQEERRRLRLRNEAQILGQLEHPGIVPVHEAGWSKSGEPYFTMRRVQGRDFAQIVDVVGTRDEGWTQTRAVDVLLRVCEAVAHAHAKGVLHRDLKPSNVMVGPFGEVYVMDWGLAKRRGQVRGESAGPTTDLLQEGAGGPADGGGSPCLTLDGEVVGTPAYMAPEQAASRPEDVDERADVYSAGAMLYHLLAGRAPYASQARVGPRAVLDAVLVEEPEALERISPRTPRELVAICHKAMARDVEARYPGIAELAEDLRAYLEGRVVRAYRTGALSELRKWVERNRGLAGALGALFAALVAGLVVSLGFYGAALRRADDVFRLSAFQDLDVLRRRADALWPMSPELIPEYEDWLVRAGLLLRDLDDHRRLLREIRAAAVPAAPDELRGHGQRDEQWWAAQLERLVAELEGLADPEQGLVAGVSAEHGLGIERRLAFLRDPLVSGGEAAREWAEAISTLADPARSPSYGGLSLRRQTGLTPLGLDPTSGLWEFAVPATGELPRRAEDTGALLASDESCLVLVLIPGGTFRLGAQKEDPAAPGYDVYARFDEAPAHEVTLAPYFLSKWEMTQGQWQRLTGRNPSTHVAGARFGDRTVSLRHPVEQVSLTECERTLARMGLALPTEAQWEHACRGGSEGGWWTGSERRSLWGSANLADESVKLLGPIGWDYEDGLDDGHVLHSPVGSFGPNPFGMHDMGGNVWEWCRDHYLPYTSHPSPGDGLRAADDAQQRVVRGGSYRFAADFARSATRFPTTPEFAFNDLGVRPARRLEP